MTVSRPTGDGRTSGAGRSIWSVTSWGTGAMPDARAQSATAGATEPSVSTAETSASRAIPASRSCCRLEPSGVGAGTATMPAYMVPKKLSAKSGPVACNCSYDTAWSCSGAIGSGLNTSAVRSGDSETCAAIRSTKLACSLICHQSALWVARKERPATCRFLSLAGGGVGYHSPIGRASSHARVAMAACAPVRNSQRGGAGCQGSDRELLGSTDGQRDATVHRGVHGSAEPAGTAHLGPAQRYAHLELDERPLRPKLLSLLRPAAGHVDRAHPVPGSPSAGPERVAAYHLPGRPGALPARRRPRRGAGPRVRGTHRPDPVRRRGGACVAASDAIRPGQRATGQGCCSHGRWGSDARPSPCVAHRRRPHRRPPPGPAGQPAIRRPPAAAWAAAGGRGTRGAVRGRAAAGRGVVALLGGAADTYAAGHLPRPRQPAHRLLWDPATVCGGGRLARRGEQANRWEPLHGAALRAGRPARRQERPAADNHHIAVREPAHRAVAELCRNAGAGRPHRRRSRV